MHRPLHFGTLALHQLGYSALLLIWRVVVELGQELRILSICGIGSVVLAVSAFDGVCLEACVEQKGRTWNKLLARGATGSTVPGLLALHLAEVGRSSTFRCILSFGRRTVVCLWRVVHRYVNSFPGVGAPC